jgi:hypothetical protein
MSENVGRIDASLAQVASEAPPRSPFKSLDNDLQFKTSFFSSWKEKTMQTKIDGLKTYSEVG